MRWVAVLFPLGLVVALFAATSGSVTAIAALLAVELRYRDGARRSARPFRA